MGADTPLCWYRVRLARPLEKLPEIAVWAGMAGSMT
jgi:hypothetical protein